MSNGFTLTTLLHFAAHPTGRATPPKNPNTAAQPAALPAGKQGRFNPHALQLQPGELMYGTPLSDDCSSRSNSRSGGTGSDNISSTATKPDPSNKVSTSTTTSSSSSSSDYRLELELHRGPRSAVWKAADGASGQPVVIKVSNACCCQFE
jgi:hypothetical protein